MTSRSRCWRCERWLCREPQPLPAGSIPRTREAAWRSCPHVSLKGSCLKMPRYGWLGFNVASDEMESLEREGLGPIYIGLAPVQGLRHRPLDLLQSHPVGRAGVTRIVDLVPDFGENPHSVFPGQSFPMIVIVLHIFTSQWLRP